MKINLAIRPWTKIIVETCLSTFEPTFALVHLDFWKYLRCLICLNFASFISKMSHSVLFSVYYIYPKNEGALKCCSILDSVLQQQTMSDSSLYAWQKETWKKLVYSAKPHQWTGNVSKAQPQNTTSTSSSDKFPLRLTEIWNLAAVTRRIKIQLKAK